MESKGNAEQKPKGSVRSEEAPEAPGSRDSLEQPSQGVKRFSLITVPTPHLPPKVPRPILPASSSKPGPKRFRFIGGYPYFKKALESRGWVDTKGFTFANCDLCFSTLVKGLDMKEIRPEQIVNHFADIHQYTWKSGLSRNLQELAWLGDDARAFAPVSFCIPEDASFESFSRCFRYFEVS